MSRAHSIRCRPRSFVPLGRGFTLIEVLIVVVIVAVLAAIAMPQFTDASDNARANNTLTSLKSLRAQLELYRVHHREEYPRLDQMWDNLIESTDAAGNLSDRGYGPYIQNPPRNPFTLSTTIVGPGDGTMDDGWEYDEQTGHVAAVGFDEDTQTFTPPGESGE